MDYSRVFAMKRERENRIKRICPIIPYSSGIYVFYRTDEAGINRAYCGQAVNLCERCASHLGEYDHIALSLKKHKFYSESNPTGWKLSDSGIQMYNVTAGSQGKGKQVTGQYKPPKTYRQGIQQGKIILARELKHIIDTHLNVSIRPEKANNKVSIKALEKFNELLNEENYH